MNHLSKIIVLKNRYIGIRHGESLCNVYGILNGDLNFSNEYPLSEDGRNRVIRNINSAFEIGFLKSPLIIFSSPFLRAKETAEILSKKSKKSPVHLAYDLRERDFLSLERQSNNWGRLLWDFDKKDPNHHYKNSENPLEMQERTTIFVKELEKMYNEETIVFVSHGDTLRNLEASFYNLSLNQAIEKIKLQEPGEIREYLLKR
ncbi:MAG: histidine phosphatase family protein [Candidatus Pacearchaeota archaeon]|jgi:broad specificity phosphatase PhoE